MGWLEPVTLRGEHAILEPLGQGHGEDLKRATADGRLWELWYTAVPTVEGMAAEIERRLELQTQASMLPFAVIEAASGEAVGMTTYMNADRVHRRLDVVDEIRQGCKNKYLGMEQACEGIEEKASSEF